VEDMSWIKVAQNRCCWRALLNTVMNLLVLLKSRNFLTS
jgi:hypothetical protein